MLKSDTFSYQLNLISNLELRRIVTLALNAAPDYFYTIAASSTGKYHPTYCLGEGGLVRHTKAAVKIAECLLQLEMYNAFLPKKDQIIAALILHDSVKKGMNESTYCTFEHPLEAAKLFRKVAEEEKYNPEDIQLICDLISSHMGQWNCNKYSKIILPKPESKIQKFVHQCDYLASRKFIEISELDT